MVRKQTKLFRLLPIVAVLAVIMVTGCAVKTKSNIWGDPASGLILTYRMADNDTLKYERSSMETQILEMMGQSMKTETASSASFSVQSKGLKENNLALGITLGDMKVDVKSMQGNLSPNLSAFKGKSFDMELTPLGKETITSGTEELKYNVGPQERKIDSGFKTFFPDLPDKPVKIGDTWTSKSDITEKGKTLEIQVVIDSVNTVEGLETVDGMECIKIKSTATGTMKGKGSQMGNQFAIDGTVKASGTWYFAYKTGVYVKNTEETSSDGTVKLNNGMSIPLTSEGKNEIKLVK